MDEVTKQELKYEKTKREAEAHAEKQAHEAYSIQRDFESWINEKWVRLKMAQFFSFPQLCELTRAQNKEREKQLKEYGIKGKYTDTYGWSKKGDFKFDYEIPNDLYMWMHNLVDKDFWDENNRRVWKTFMYRICRGDQPWEIFLWIKKLYGIDPEERLKRLQKKARITSLGLGTDGKNNKSTIIKASR